MKTKLMMIGALAAACAVNELAAMPTAEETRRAEPVVKKLLASEREALKAGRSRSRRWNWPARPTRKRQNCS